MGIIFWVFFVIILLTLIVFILKNSRNKESETIKDPILEELKNLSRESPRDELNLMIGLMKKFIYREFEVNEKLSLEEIAKRLNEINEVEFANIVEEISGRYYSGEKIEENENEKLKEKIMEAMKMTLLKKEIIERKQKREETIIEKLETKKNKLRGSLRSQKGLVSKLKR